MALDSLILTGYYTYKQIHDRMGTQRRTAEGFRETLIDEFGVKSKTGLVLFAVKSGIVKP